MPKKKKYYGYCVPGNSGAVAHGAVRTHAARVQGVADDWAQCEKIVSGKPGARFKAFERREDAAAWVARGAAYETPARSVIKSLPGVYFDAGTGRGNGVEISVTDEKGKNLLHKVVAEKKLNAFGKHLVARGSATNNYGELLALKYALQIAKKERQKKIFGDSKLVIEYWSRWRIKKRELSAETVSLAEEVAELRAAFEVQGGVVQRISGDHNPADLGFHR